MAPKIVLFSLLAAVAAFSGALLMAAVGQGLGALVGGCTWIGASTPLDRQVWALVNQPTLHFSSLPRAVGYWAGSYLLPLMVGVGSIPLLPRARTLAAELVTLHAAWAATLVGVAWMPLVDPVDGHLSRWLDLWNLPHALVWLGPALALPAAALVTLRLLSLVRIIRHLSSRGLRLAAVMLHLLAPAAAWVGLATAIRGGLNPWPTVAVGATAAAVLAVAWFGYPPAFPHRLEILSRGSWLRIGAAGAVLTVAVVGAGRPLAEDRTAGVLWAHPGSYNNVRPWIEATSIAPGTRSTGPDAEQESGTSNANTPGPV